MSPKKFIDLTLENNGGGGGGDSDKYFEFTQGIASEIWNINHNLNKKPSTMTVDSSGRVVIGEEQYIDDNNVILKFNSKFKGKSYLN